jgi:hypothetical protein
MRMADHDICDVFRFHAGLLYGFVGPQVILDGPLLEPALPVKAAVEKNIAAAAANQPDDKVDVDFLVFGAIDHQGADRNPGRNAVAYGLDGILDRCVHAHQRQGKCREHESIQHGFDLRLWVMRHYCRLIASRVRA